MLPSQLHTQFSTLYWSDFFTKYWTSQDYKSYKHWSHAPQDALTLNRSCVKNGGLLFPKDFIDWWIASREKEQHRSHTIISSPPVSLITASGQQATNKGGKKKKKDKFSRLYSSNPTLHQLFWRKTTELVLRQRTEC